MISSTDKKIYYKALIEKKSAYEGLFYVGVKTTGVFCRPTCPAKKPKFENCEFFLTAKEALLASFRPCKRCQPLSYPNDSNPTIKTLIEAIEANPEKRWKTTDLRQLKVDDSTARRQFKKRYGMTFLEYARSRRMGIAMKQIKEGKTVIDTQLSSGYESSGGFRDAFSRIMGAAPTKSGDTNIFKAAWIDTILGPMVAIADHKGLYLLEFIDRRGLEKEVENLRKKLKAAIIPGDNKIIHSIKAELENYFTGKACLFKTPLHFIGSDFQKAVWQQLTKIPTGETRSYLSIAKALNHPKACRAVARANGANQLAIVIPCHRVINTNGEVGGYGGGITRKNWLLQHEKKFKKS